jgi:hypothetical protein
VVKAHYQKKPPGLEEHYGVRIRRWGFSLWFKKHVLIVGWERSAKVKLKHLFCKNFHWQVVSVKTDSWKLRCTKCGYQKKFL